MSHIGSCLAGFVIIVALYFTGCIFVVRAAEPNPYEP
jgi:hypothetical protein